MEKILIPLLLITISLTMPSGTSKGTASYYGRNYTGRLTSSGERFHKDSLFGAHKTLKFGTLVKVTNLINDSIRIVKINDRLPKSSKRIIDLSYGTAKQLNFIKRGITPVSIEIVGSSTIKK
jgi:rare lipoprotein A